MSPMITMQEKKVVSWDNTRYGFSGPGNATSAACWQIYKEVTTAGVTITYVAAWNGLVTDIAGNQLATDAVGVVVPTWA